MDGLENVGAWLFTLNVLVETCQLPYCCVVCAARARIGSSDPPLLFAMLVCCIIMILSLCSIRGTRMLRREGAPAV